MEIKKEQLKNEIWDMVEIYLDANHCLEYAYYLHFPRAEDERAYIASSNHLLYLRTIILKMAIIEIVKLFSKRKSDRYSVFCFIEKLKSGSYYGEFGISNDKISIWEERLSDSGRVIKGLITLRDKHYAHTDSDRDKHPVDKIIFKDLKKLLSIIEDVFNEIYSSVFESYLDLSSPIFDRDKFELINNLISYEKQRKLEYESYFKGRSKIE